MTDPSSWPEVPGYEIDAVLGQGGFATVYRARQVSVNRMVALKVTAASLSDPAAERAFRGETEKIGSLSWHPHVVVLHDAGVTSGGKPYLAMELVTGGTWGDRVRERGPLDPEIVAQVGLETADALAAAHESQIVHRDVKPDNVLIGRREQALLGDFGIATLSDATGATTRSFVGTLAYSAPELLQGERATPRSDVFSLGATLYTLAVGQGAFSVDEGASPAAVIWQVVSEPTPPLPEHLPRPLRVAIERAMAKDPAERYAGAEQMQTALAAVLASGGSSAPPLGRPGGGPAAPTAPSAPPPTPAATPAWTPGATATPSPPTPSSWTPGSAATPAPPAWTPGPAATPAPPAWTPGAAPWTPDGPNAGGPPPVAPTPPPAPVPGPAPQPQPPPAPVEPAKPTSALAVLGLVASIFCLSPVALVLAVIAHLRIRRGRSGGLTVVIVTYVFVIVGLLAQVGVWAIIGQIRDDIDPYVGRWEAIEGSATIELEAVSLGTSVEGTYMFGDGGTVCTGVFDDSTLRDGQLILGSTGRCDPGGPATGEVRLRLEDGGDTLVVSPSGSSAGAADGLRLRRAGP